jgi:molybdate transport system ATP-binding protein
MGAPAHATLAGADGVIDCDLTVTRGALVVQARLAVAGRGVTAVIGRSGAGKTTLLHAIAGLVRPSAGTLRVAGRVLFDAARRIDVPAHQRALAVVFQDGRLFPHLTVRANLRYGARLAHGRDGPAFDDVVALLGIAALLDRRPHLLSGGERQRVAIGRALLSRPQALLLDEPLASLDPPRRHELLGYLAQLPPRFAMPLLYVTHQTDEVLRLADDLVVLDAGRVVARGPALELLGDPALQPHVGRFDAGSVLAGTVAEHLAEWQLTRVVVAGQPITVPQLDAAPGRAVRLRIRARDVALQREVLPSSASNQLGGTVLRVLDRDGPYAAVEVALRPEAPAGERLWALVTKRSVHTLGLAPGQPVVAGFKAVAVEGRSAALHDAPGAQA